MKKRTAILNKYNLTFFSGGKTNHHEQLIVGEWQQLSINYSLRNIHSRLQLITNLECLSTE